MIIRCETNNNHNRFYLPNIDTMQELKEYADNNIPIECYKLGGRYKFSIYLEEDLKLVHLYLNNYLQYYQVGGYILNNKEMDGIINTICSECVYDKNNRWWDCEYEKSDSGCKNYKERPMSKVKKFIKRII